MSSPWHTIGPRGSAAIRGHAATTGRTRAFSNGAWGHMAHMHIVYSVVLLSLSMATATSAQPPIRQLPAIVSPTGSQAAETANVSGTVLDVSGGAVSGAEVTLTESGGSDRRSTVTGADGTFAFTELPAGSYAIATNAQGFQPYTSATFILTPQQAF